MKNKTAFKANPSQKKYWLLNNKDVNFVENDTSIISTASKFIHEKYRTLDAHICGEILNLHFMVDNGTKTLAMQVKVLAGDLPKSTLIAVAGMHYGNNPMNQKLIKLYQHGALKKGTRLDFRGVAITYYLWKGIPLNHNFLMYDVGVNRNLPTD